MCRSYAGMRCLRLADGPDEVFPHLFFGDSFARNCVDAALDLSDDCDVAGASRHHRQAALIPKDVQTLKRANLQATDVALSRGITSHGYSYCLHSNFSHRKCGENLPALTYE